ncbi:MAG: ubiquinone/menaquinone biosynthesis methyltransferase [Gemmatimonas sp.]|nr:ubiquinone/menaquinone biosynthesis methyltransferase [Gemmatimonas sp.]
MTLRSSALPSDEEKAAQVRRMFSSIAPRYDLLNHLLSMNVDRWWRRKAVDRLGWEREPTGTYLDNCAGTLDLSIELARRPGFAGTVVGSDFAFPMLRIGEEKSSGHPIEAICADALSLPYRAESFDGATIGFGIRNVANLDTGLGELHRVLRPGARIVVLEFTTPAWKPFRAIYFYYFQRVLPFIGKLVSKHGSAYSYLPESVLRFPEPPELAARLEGVGFVDVGWTRLSGGIVALHWGRRS